MKTINKITFAASFLFACSVSHAANHMVQSGQNLQTVLTNAASGDLVLLQDGFYDEDCVLANKAITIKSISPSSIAAAQVRSITLTNSPAPSVFSHIRLLSDLNASGATVTLRDCDVLGNLNKTNGDLKVYRTNVGGNLTATKAGLTLIKSTVDGDVTVADAQDDANRELSAIVVQSTIGERFVCKAKRSLTCYNLIRHAYFEGEVEITGNDFDGRENFPAIGVDVNGTTTYARIRNNQVRNYKESNTVDITDQYIGIRITGGARADIVNNLIYNCYDSLASGTETNCGIGIFVQSTTGTKIIGNVIWRCYVHGNSQVGCPVLAPFKDVVFKNNYLLKGSQHSNSYARGGVQGADNVHDNSSNTTPLKFVDSGSGDFHLQADSPLKNAGPPDAFYNDRDGTRNDMGMYGGHNFIPDGRTTIKPIPIRLNTAPIFVPTGGVITIESTGATPK